MGIFIQIHILVKYDYMFVSSQLITFDQVLSIATHLLSFCLSHLTTCGSRCIAPGPASPPDPLVLTNANMCFAWEEQYYGLKSADTEEVCNNGWSAGFLISVWHCVETENVLVLLLSKNVIFAKVFLRRQKIMWSCLARQRSGLLVTFLLLLGLTIFKEFEVRGQGEQNLPAVTENKVKRIFEEKPGGFPTVDEVVRTNLSDVKTEDKPRMSKSQPRCHFKAPTENRWNLKEKLSAKFSICWQNSDFPLRCGDWLHLDCEKCLQDSAWQPAVVLCNPGLLSGWLQFGQVAFLLSSYKRVIHNVSHTSNGNCH